MFYNKVDQDKIIALLLSKEEANVLLALEFIKQKDYSSAFTAVLIFLKMVHDFEDESIMTEMEALLNNFADEKEIAEHSKALDLIQGHWGSSKTVLDKQIADYEHRMELYDSFLKQASHYAAYYNEIGKSLLRKNKRRKGYAYLAKAAFFDSDNVNFHFDCAYYFKECKKYALKIVYHYQKCLELGKKEMIVYHNKARIHAYYLDQPKIAQVLLEEGLKIAPNSTDSLVELAYILEDEQAAESRLHLEKAIAIDEHHALAHNNYAFLLWSQFKEFDLAKKHALLAVDLHPYDAVFWHTLAEIEWFGHQDASAAIKALEQGKEADTRYDSGDEFLEELRYYLSNLE